MALFRVVSVGWSKMGISWEILVANYIVNTVGELPSSMSRRGAANSL
jgi:hypothetical protein